MSCGEPLNVDYAPHEWKTHQKSTVVINLSAKYREVNEDDNDHDSQ